MFIAQELYRTDSRSYYYFFLMFRLVSLRVLLEKEYVYILLPFAILRMFSKHHRKYIKQFSLPAMSNRPMILGLLSNTTPSKLISSAKPLWRRWKGLGSCIKRMGHGEESLSFDLHFAPPPLIFLRLLKSFHSFFSPLLKTLSTILIYLQTESRASLGHLSYACGYSTLFTTLSGVYTILSIQTWNRSRCEPGSVIDGIGYIVVSITSFGEVWN